MWWKPRYRIVFDHDFAGDGAYRAQVWRFWWPKWVWVSSTFADTAERAEERLRANLIPPHPQKPDVVRYIGTLCILVLLAACTPTTPPGPVCPPLVAYTAAEQAQAAAELRAPPEKPALGRMVADYITVRDRIRSLCK